MEISELVGRGQKDVWESKTEERLYHWFASKEPYEIKTDFPIFIRRQKNGSVKQASIIAGAMENAVKEYVKRGICSPEDSKEIRQLTESFCDLRELFWRI